MVTMDNYFNTNQLVAHFGVSRQAIYDRANALADFLEPGAVPGGRKDRKFSEHDVQVMAFAHQMLKDENASFDEIIVALRQNPELPPAMLTDAEINEALTSDKEKRAILQVQVLMNEVTLLREDNARLKEDASRTKELELEVARLQAQLEIATKVDTSTLYETIGELRGELNYIRRQLGK